MKLMPNLTLTLTFWLWLAAFLQRLAPVDHTLHDACVMEISLSL